MGRGEEVPPAAGQDVESMGASWAGPERWALICPGTHGRIPARAADMTCWRRPARHAKISPRNRGHRFGIVRTSGRVARLIHRPKAAGYRYQVEPCRRLQGRK